MFNSTLAVNNGDMLAALPAKVPMTARALIADHAAH
jgi:hypothetical protein